MVHYEPHEANWYHEAAALDADAEHYEPERPGPDELQAHGFDIRPRAEDPWSS